MNELLKHTDRFHIEEMKLYLCLRSHNRLQIEKLQQKKQIVLRPAVNADVPEIVNASLKHKAMGIIANSNNVNVQGLHKHCHLLGYVVIMQFTTQ